MAARRRAATYQTGNIGYWAFLIGILIAIVAGIVAASGALDAQSAGMVAIVLVILGIIVGFLNILDKDLTTFLIAVIALGLTGASAGGLALIPYVGLTIANIVIYVGAFVAPAAVIVAVKVIWDLATS